MKERILFECVGQGAGNIGRLLMDMGFICHFINTSNDDLNSIQVRDEFKYHIPNANGCNKDRKKAMYYAKDYYEHITNVIDNGFPRQDIVYFIFSLGGGTGSGLAPVMLNYLIQKNPHKKYGAVIILPSLKEPIKAQENATEAYAQLSSIKGLKSIFILDNNYADKFEINENFANDFNRLMNISIPDPRGVIDGAELETILTCSGVTVMGELSLEPMMKFYNMIYAPYRRGCKYLALTCADDFNVNSVESIFGTPLDMFIGYNDKSNFLVATGLPFYTKRITELVNNTKDRLDEREKDQVAFSLDIPVIEKRVKHTPEVKRPTKVSFDDLFNKFIE